MSDPGETSAGESPAQCKPALRAEIGVLAVAVCALALYANAAFLVTDPQGYRFFPPFKARVNANINMLLGAENLNIGVALASGRGFSDPFAQQTGPTAWMPPLYPALLAILLLATGFHVNAVVACIVLLETVTMILSGALVLVVARDTAQRLRPHVALWLYLLWLVAHFWWFFQQTHDIWLILLLIDLTLAGLWYGLGANAGRLRYLAWGLLGGTQFLANPVSGLAWGALTGVHGLRERRIAATLGALVLAATCCSVWVARNAIVFDRFVFIKSNLFYDLYSGAYRSEDGVYDEAFFMRYHPFAQALKNSDFAYKRMGEVAYMDSFHDRFLESFHERPGVYFEKATNRLLAATLVHKAYNGSELWPVLTRIVRPLPLLGLLALLLLRRLRIGRVAGAALLFATVYLLPYVAVAYYVRYLLPLTPVLVLFMFWGADALAQRFGGDRAPAGSLLVA